MKRDITMRPFHVLVVVDLHTQLERPDFVSMDRELAVAFLCFFFLGRLFALSLTLTVAVVGLGRHGYSGKRIVFWMGQALIAVC
jgi:hypothetical protein